MGCRIRAVAAGAAALTAATLPCAPPSAAAPSGWRAAPAGAHARPYFYLEGAPGSVLTDRLALTNRGRQARTFTVSGSSGSGAGAWIATAARTVRVPARTRAEVPFTVTVPAGAAPGDHPAALRVRDQRGAERAVRVHLRVSGPMLAALTVENVSVADRGGAAVIRYDLVNRGNTTLDPRVVVRADGLLGGELHRPAHAASGDLPPGQRITRTENWADPPALDSVDVAVTATAAGGAHGTARARYTAVPWGAVGWAAAGGGAAVGGWFLRRRRRAGADDSPVQEGDPVRELTTGVTA
ncbi:FixG Ig-like domain-containing protein [Streptomyces sp. NPDC053542]|uniref:COG1470 family protein n=1 Tax=Streptomyces sp. NPDC053542 TaxID=3365710 RepID=UPI0037D8A0C3